MVSDLPNERALHAEVTRLREENAALRARLANSLPESRAAPGAFAELLQALPALVAQIGPDLEMKYLNRFEEGYREEDVIGTSILAFMDPAYHSQAIEAITRARNEGSAQRYQAAVRRDDGWKAHYETVVAPVNGTGDCVLLSFDVTGYAERQQALADRESQLRSSVEAAGVGLWRYDVATDQVHWNARMKQIMGRDEPLEPKRYLALAVHPDDRHLVTDAMAKVMDGETNAWVRHRIVRPDGEVHWVLPTGMPTRNDDGDVVAVVGGTFDVTQLQALEQRLRQAEKMESLATLTTGVAHNLNNLLGVARPTMDLLEEYVLEPGRELLDAAVVSLDRAATVVRQLMTFAGKRHAAIEGDSLPVVPVVTRALNLARRSVPDEIRIEFEPKLDGVYVRGDADELSEVLHNLVLNARDALASVSSKAELRAGVPQISVSLEAAQPPSGSGIAADDEFVLLTVADNGPGMSEAVRLRIFDPFFTTKGPGRGTGLGLAISWSTVQSAGGTIQCESAPGAGARFRVYLPRAASAPEAPPPISSCRSLSRQILLVEDDHLLRKTIARALTRAGHKVTTAGSLRAALAAACAEMDVVLLDQSLPDGLGTDIAPALRELCDGVRIVLFTGQDVGDDELGQVDVMLAKPATTHAILAALEPSSEPS